MGESDRDASGATTELQAPPPAVPGEQPTGTPTRADAPHVAAPDPLASASAGPFARGKLRRRLRRLKSIRSKQLADLGTLVVDARKRADGSRPEVLERRAAEVAEVDRQVRDLSHAVDSHADARELATGIAGTCAVCADLLATDDRFCPSCGTPTKPGRKRPADPAPTPAGDAAAAPVAPVVPPPPADGEIVHVDRANIPPPPLPPPLPAAVPPAASPEVPAAESPGAPRTAPPSAEPSAPAPPEPPAPDAVAPRPPPADAPLPHVDPTTIPPPPPPPPK